MAKNIQSSLSEQVTQLISKINEKNPFLIVWIGVGLIIIVFYLLFFQAKIKEMTVLNAEIGNLAQTLDQTKSNLLRLDQYNSEVSNLRKKIAFLNNKIKSKEEIPAALERLSRLASENGVKIEQMMPDEVRSEIILENDEGRFIAIPVVIGARSGYHDFGRFINKLEGTGIFLGIPDFGVMANSADSNNHLVKLVLRLVVFEQADKNDKAAKKGKRNK